MLELWNSLEKELDLMRWAPTIASSYFAELTCNQRADCQLREC